MYSELDAIDMHALKLNYILVCGANEEVNTRTRYKSRYQSKPRRGSAPKTSGNNGTKSLYQGFPFMGLRRNT